MRAAVVAMQGEANRQVPSCDRGSTRAASGRWTRSKGVVVGPRVPYGTRSPFDMKSLWEPR